MKKIGILFFSICLAVAISAQDDKNYKRGLSIGDVASDFSLKNVDGEMVSLESMKGANGYVVIFTCNHCPYAVMYEDRINDLNKKYAPLGYPVVAINPNDPDVKPGDSYDNMILRAEEKAFSFPYLFDAGQHIYPLYGAKKTPHVFLLDQNRVVRYIGAIDDNPRDPEGVTETYLSNAIDALMTNVNINPEVTKAIGCSIKTKS